MIGFTFLQYNSWDECNNIETICLRRQNLKRVWSKCVGGKPETTPQKIGELQNFCHKMMSHCWLFLRRGNVISTYLLYNFAYRRILFVVAVSTFPDESHHQHWHWREVQTPVTCSSGVTYCTQKMPAPSGEWGNTYLALLGTQNFRQLREPLLARSDPRVMMPHRQSS